MKTKIIAVLAFLLLFGGQALAINYPNPVGHVNDFANIIPTGEKNKLEKELRKYREDTTIEIAVVTVTSLDDLSVEEYTLDLAMKWGVGNKKKDNGLVFLVAPNERKARIEVGYGLEGDLTDAQANRIMQDKIIPYFKKGQMSGGIIAGTLEIIRVLGRTPYAARAEEKEIAAQKAAADSAKTKAMLLSISIWLAVIIIIAGAVIWIVSRVKRWLNWRREMKLLHAENSEKLKKIDEKMAEAEREFEPARNVLAELSKEFSKDVWQDLSLELGDYSSLTCNMHIKNGSAKISHELGWKNAENASALISELLDFTETRSSFLEKVEAVRNSQAEARIMSKQIIAEYPEKNRLGIDAMNRADVSTASKLEYQKAYQAFEKTEKKAGGEHLNWLSVLAELKNANSLLADAVRKSDADIKYARRARTEGPHLLVSLPESIEKAERAVKQQDVTPLTKQMAADAKEKYAEAKKIIKASGGVQPADWVKAFGFILGAKTLAEEAVKKAASDRATAEQQRRKKKEDEEESERQRRRRHSDNYGGGIVIGGGSGGGGSEGFSGFGGGSFGGGGASGSW